MTSKKLVQVFGIITFFVVIFSLFFSGNKGRNCYSHSKDETQTSSDSRGLGQDHRVPSRTAPLPVGDKFVRGPADISVPSGLTPEKARHLMSQASSLYPDINERSVYCAALLRSLCEAGFSEEAWLLIDPVAGMLRRGQLSQFFASAQLEKGRLFELMRDDPSELGSSLRGYLRRFTPSELKSILESGELTKYLGDDLKGAQIEGGVVVSLQLALTRAAPVERENVVEEIAKMYQDRLIDARAFFDILNRESVGDSFERWRLLQSAGIEDGGEDREFRDAMIRSMVDADGARALDLIAQTHGDDTIDLEAGFRQWLQNDPVSASSWFHQRISKMTDNQRDAVRAANFLNAVEFRDFESARAWLNEVSSVERKATLSSKLIPIN